jgi:hypothetical protein
MNIYLNVNEIQKAKTPPRAGGWKQLKLTDKPLSFGYSVVDSHSSHHQKAKTPPRRGLEAVEADR